MNLNIDYIKSNARGLSIEQLIEYRNKYRRLKDEEEEIYFNIVSEELEYRGINCTTLEYNEEDCTTTITISEKETEFPMNTEYTDSRNMDFKTLGLITLYSKFKGKTVCELEGYDYSEIENHRYLYDSEINEQKKALESLSNNKIRTIKRNINKLASCNNNVVVQMSKDGSIYYKINPYAQNGNGMGKFVTIEESILRYLVNVYNSNTIKVYCTIKWLLYDKDKRCFVKRQLTRDFLCRQIGLSVSSKNNLQVMTDILNSLTASGLIKRTMKANTEATKENGQTQTKTIYEYEIATVEEFKEYTKNLGKR